MNVFFRRNLPTVQCIYLENSAKGNASRYATCGQVYLDKWLSTVL